jgi:hypothetical protein
MQVLPPLFETIVVVVTLGNFFLIKYILYKNPFHPDLSKFEYLIDFCFILFLTLLKEIFSYKTATVLIIGLIYFIL